MSDTNAMALHQGDCDEHGEYDLRVTAECPVCKWWCEPDE